MTRIKAPTLATRLEFERTVDEIARVTVDLRKAEARRDAHLQKVRDDYEPPCQALAEQLQGLALAAEKYAETHREDLFPSRVKSAETPLAFFGFRLGNPTLKLLNRKWSWDAVVEQLRARGLTGFVRTKEEADKDLLKAKLPAEELAAIGCKVEQGETFYVDPKEKQAEERVA
jgi:phage host-nuclease inhibitor protein Gam